VLSVVLLVVYVVVLVEAGRFGFGRR